MNTKTQQLVVFLLILVACAFVVYVSGTQYTISCDKKTNTCEMRERSFSDPETSLTGQFKVDNIIDVLAEKKMDNSGKYFYDLGFDYGPNGKYFIGFGFNTLIKVNTAKMAFKAFLDNPYKNNLLIKKDCYFNKYWCL